MAKDTGLINQLIKIYKYQDVDDGTATGSIPKPVLYWDTRAEVKVLKANRGLQANQEKLKPAARFELRFRDDKFITDDMTLEWRGVNFTIQSAEPDFTYKRLIVIMATAEKLPQR